MYKCRVCSIEAGGAAVLHVPEMMIGTRESFEYFHCIRCGSLSIVEIPENLGWYYKQDYYSFNGLRDSNSASSIFRSRMRKRRIRGRLGSSNLMDRIAHHLRPVHFHWMFQGSMDLNSRILDVGCGSGKLLHEMSHYGFSDLTGIDPFLPKEIELFKGNPKLLRKKMEDLHSSHYDIVMLHHAFEHMEQPEVALTEVCRLLSPNGKVLIRVPVSDSYAFRKYGRFWNQIDAPRHLFVPSVSGMYALAKSAGLKVEKLDYDSNGFHLSSSEAYMQGRTLMEAREMSSNYRKSSFQHLAKYLNTINDGDQACFWLSKEAPN